MSVDFISQSSVTASCRELASGFDALYFSAECAIHSSWFDYLQDAKTAAVEADGSVGIEFGGEDFLIAPRGLSKYRFRVECPFGIIGISPSVHLPTFYVQPYAEFIHRVGIESAVAYFCRVIERVAVEPKWSASRVDLYVDVQGWIPDIDLRRDFQCRARKRTGYEMGDEFNGLQFGSRGSGTVFARIYDKTIESAKRENKYVVQTWNDLYVPGEPVIRVEFQVMRDALVDYKIHSLEDVFRLSPSLWVTLSSSWLTLREHSDDSNCSRWPVATEWKVVQAASLGGHAIGLHRMKSDHRVADLESIAPALMGYMASVGAIEGASSLTDALECARGVIEKYESRTGRSFMSRVAHKQGSRSFLIPEILR